MNLGGISLTATVAWALSHTFPIDFYLVFQFLKFIFSPIKKYYMYLHETTNSESLDKFMFTKRSIVELIKGTFQQLLRWTTLKESCQAA